jgi:peroxiredoxin
MKNIKTILLGASLLLLTTTGFAQSWKTGDKAPTFSAKASDGKTYSLDTLSKKGSFVLYFIKTDCPTNTEAIIYYKRLATAYKNTKVKFIGVINADKAGFDEWQKEHKVDFPVLLDPSKTIIRTYKAYRSPWTILVGKDKKIVKETPGYCTPSLNELNALMAKAAGTKAKKCDFTGAPDDMRYG